MLNAKLSLKKWLLVGLCLAAISQAPLLYAHQQKEAYVTILFNDNSGNLEVSHRFLLHDVDHVMQQRFASKDSIAYNKNTQQYFADYLQTTFELQTGQQSPISLSTVGFEVEGKFFWVYQEVLQPEVESLIVRHSALHEQWPSQTNHINIERGGQVSSARLTKDKPSAELPIP